MCSKLLVRRKKLWKLFRFLPSSKSKLPKVNSVQVSATRQIQLRTLETILGYSFRQIGFLDRALTHRSYTHEYAEMFDAPSYESLEFLGDAILGFLIGEKLFLFNQELSEGDLSKIRSYLVSTKRLAEVSAKICLGDYLHLSRGEEKTGGKNKPAILADLFESVIAAIYLDGGIDPTRDFVIRQFKDDFNKLQRGEIAFRDPKSQLQERLHQQGCPAPVYRVVSESGPDHRKQFEVSVSSEGQVLGCGSGGSKKQAEKSAANKAMLSFQNEKDSNS